MRCIDNTMVDLYIYSPYSMYKYTGMYQVRFSYYAMQSFSFCWEAEKISKLESTAKDSILTEAYFFYQSLCKNLATVP